VPTIFGVITADTVEQAIDRRGLKHGEYRVERGDGGRFRWRA